jgi:hypothetical protein
VRRPGQYVDWDDCYHEDRGDGVLILMPPQVPKAALAAGVPAELAAAVHAHNQAHDRNARIWLRLALHAGEVLHDVYGVTGTAVNLAFRLLEAGQLKQALAGSPGVLAVIASAWFYDEVIRHNEQCAPATWRRVLVTVKETREDGWISLPDAPYPAQPDAGCDPARPLSRPAIRNGHAVQLVPAAVPAVRVPASRDHLLDLDRPPPAAAARCPGRTMTPAGGAGQGCGTAVGRYAVFLRRSSHR